MIFKPANRVTLHSEILEQLTASIQDGQWPVGCKLPGEMALAEMFQVSRTCIREVLKALAYSGIVEARPGLGTFVKEVPKPSSPSAAMVNLLKSAPYSSFLEVRRLLEGQAAYWAAARATPEELAELERILENKEGQSLKNLHRQFHSKVAALSKNPIFIHMIAQLEEQYASQREMNFVILPDEDRLEHWRVLEAIKTGNPTKAKKAMQQHVDFIWKKHKFLEAKKEKIKKAKKP